MAINLEQYKTYKLPTSYQEFIFLSHYARYRDDLGRRETWPECVHRYVSYMAEHIKKFGTEFTEQEEKEIFEAILYCEVMPSMRCLMAAGPALDKNAVSGYNCAYTQIDSIESFAEVMFILMSGTGVGFSVERQVINKLPDLPKKFIRRATDFLVVDSREGWAEALHMLLDFLYFGEIPTWDLSRLRPAGAKLKSFGGRASGPGPLNDLFHFVVSTFESAVNSGQRKLTSEQCHHIVTKIGEVVVSGGSRRSALISLSNPSDDRMRHIKSGNWWETAPHLSLANNSAAWTEKPSPEIFLKEWLALMESKSGERGIFNREAAKKKCPSIGRDSRYEFGTNPCGEIILRDKQFCNLSSVVVRPKDDLVTLAEKVRIATILGTIQSTFTNFHFISEEWKKNSEEERLLGVSLSGIYDNYFLLDDPMKLYALNLEATRTNLAWAKRLNINPSKAITCNKPEGTCSQLVNSSSGIHPRYSPWYLRAVRLSKNDPIAIMMMEKGWPSEEDRMNNTTQVFYFPMCSPANSWMRSDLSAIEHLETWRIFSKYWCDHNPSATIMVRPEEWISVGAWVYDHFDEVLGLTFLPYSDHIYQQAPYQELTLKEYDEWMKKLPEINFNHLCFYEQEDNTTVNTELACTGGSCEL